MTGKTTPSKVARTFTTIMERNCHIWMILGVFSVSPSAQFHTFVAIMCSHIGTWLGESGEEALCAHGSP